MVYQSRISSFYIKKIPSLLNAMPNIALFPFHDERGYFNVLKNLHGGCESFFRKSIHPVATRVPCFSFRSPLARCWESIIKMLCVTTLWLACAPHIANFVCLWIDFGIDDLTRWKGSLTTGMNTLPLLTSGKRSKG